MKYVVERMDLTDPLGRLEWSATPSPQRLCEVQGGDADSVLAGLVAKDGGVQLGVSASFTNGEALLVAQNGAVVYALRAIPAEVSPRARPAFR